MNNFFYSVPTKIAFGKGEIEKLPGFVKECGSKVLIVYGGGSIKRSGILDKTIKLLKDNNIGYEELSGVEPNPRLSTVNKGIKICKENNIDVILPIGGGSALDCGKAIAAGFYYNGNPWDLVLDNSKIVKALPLVTILTLSATGSEMDGFSVITNEETKDKMDLSSSLLYPVYSILDPEYTYTVPKYQTASGTADIMSHIFEIYFNGVKDTYIQDRVMEALLKTCIEFGPIAYNNPDDYNARANLMWTSSWAINGFISCGKSGPWPCHGMEHQLSAYYDVTHGHGLAILTPVWMKYILDDTTVEMFATYGKNVFGIEGDDLYEVANKAIDMTKEVYEKMGLTSTLREIGIKDDSKFEEMAVKAVDNGLENCYFPLKKQDVINIYKKCL